jgi:hypothetical protein
METPRRFSPQSEPTGPQRVSARTLIKAIIVWILLIASVVGIVAEILQRNWAMMTVFALIGVAGIAFVRERLRP